MSEPILVRPHPTLQGVLARSDGSVFLPESGFHPAKWTYGYETPYGYRSVKIRGRKYLVHRIVAESFHENPENLPTVDHINRIKSDNRPENLRFASYKTQATNTVKVDRELASLGVRKCEDTNAYFRSKMANDEGYRKKKSDYNKSYARNRYRSDPEYRKRLSERRKERYRSDPEYRNRILSSQNKKYHSDEQFRKSVLSRQKSRYNENKVCTDADECIRTENEA